MKKTPCSLGQYVLKDIEKTRGMEGYGFLAELWKGKKLIGTLEDYGDGGGVNARIRTGIPAEEREELAKEVYSDMLSLLDISKAADNSLARTYWGKTPYGAMECFGELLLELTELVKVAKKVEKKSNGKPYAVMQAGSHWLDPIDDSIRPTDMVGFCLGTTPKSKFMGVTKATVLSQTNENMNIVLLKFVEEPIKWSLSFKDYAQMLENARELRKI